MGKAKKRTPAKRARKNPPGSRKTIHHLTAVSLTTASPEIGKPRLEELVKESFRRQLMMEARTKLAEARLSIETEVRTSEPHTRPAWTIAVEELLRHVENNLALVAGTKVVEDDDGWQLWQIKQVIARCYPNGRVPADAANKVIQARLIPFFEELGWKRPSLESIRRARKSLGQGEAW